MTSLEVKQSGFKDCASACLLSIIRYYGGNLSMEEISLIIKTNKDGTNAYNLICGAKLLGFDGYGIKYTYEDIINNKASYPIIVHTLKNNMYHFIVVYEIKSKYIKVMDPEVGYSKITYETFKKMYLGTSIVLYPVKKFDSLNGQVSLFKFICNYLKYEVTLCIKIILLSILVISLSIINNYYMKIVVNTTLNIDLIVIISILFLSLMLSKSIFEYIRNNYLTKVNSKINAKINNDFVRHLLNLPYQFFKVKSTGEVISRLNDLKSFKEIFSSIIVNLFVDILFIITSMCVLLVLNYNLFFIVLIFMIFYFFIVFVYSKINKNKIYLYQINDGEYNKILTESIEGYESNKNINVINYVYKKLEGKYISYVNSVNDYEHSYNREYFIKEVLNNLSNILVMLVGIIYIRKSLISLGDFLVFNSMIIYFTEPLKNILNLEPNLRYIKGVYNRISDLLVMKSESINEANNMIKGDIEINNLSYSYDNVNYLFNNVNLLIKYSSKYLIFGSSGNGKSTILKLILRYLNDYKGEIKINNTNILDIDKSVIASSFTYASQNSYLINDTLKNNIIMFRDINVSTYEKILEICNVDKIRDSKMFRNDFIIEDNGFNLSGGERQKIVLARTLLKECNYILLDEALSEVGVNEEKEILRKIFNYFKDKTIIYVSHKKEIIDYFSAKYYLERSNT